MTNANNTFKTFITKSKAGHYTVTIYQMYGTKKQCVFVQRLINNIVSARHVASEFVGAN